MTWKVFDPELMEKEMAENEACNFCNRIFAEHKELVPFSEVERLLGSKSIETLTAEDKLGKNLERATIIEKIIFESLEKNSEKIEHFKTCPNFSIGNKKLDFSNEKYIFTRMLANNILFFHYIKKDVNKENILCNSRDMRIGILSFFRGHAVSLAEEEPSVSGIYLSLKWYMADTGTELDLETTKQIEEYENKLKALTVHRYTLEGEEIKQGDKNI